MPPLDSPGPVRDAAELWGGSQRLAANGERAAEAAGAGQSGRAAEAAGAAQGRAGQRRREAGRSRAGAGDAVAAGAG